jgi:hypothetical protein
MGILLYLVASAVLFALFAMVAGVSSTLWGFGALHWVCAIWVLYCTGAAIKKQTVRDQTAQEMSPVPGFSSLADIQQ